MNCFRVVFRITLDAVFPQVVDERRGNRKDLGGREGDFLYEKRGRFRGTKGKLRTLRGEFILPPIKTCPHEFTVGAGALPGVCETRLINALGESWPVTSRSHEER
jgi:hypothetical protein